jgi:hypothetical protein
LLDEYRRKTYPPYEPIAIPHEIKGDVLKKIKVIDILEILK